VKQLFKADDLKVHWYMQLLDQFRPRSNASCRQQYA